MSEQPDESQRRHGIICRKQVTMRKDGTAVVEDFCKINGLSATVIVVDNIIKGTTGRTTLADIKFLQKWAGKNVKDLAEISGVGEPPSI